ncbi:hypothetical protein Tco_1471668 [Tanacetum coccineum]
MIEKRLVKWQDFEKEIDSLCCKYDTYLENLKGELSFVEAENAKHSNEVENLMKGYLEDSIRLQSNLEGLNSSLEFIQSHRKYVFFFDSTKKKDI